MHPNRYARRTVLWGTVLAAGLCVDDELMGNSPKQPAPVPA